MQPFDHIKQQTKMNKKLFTLFNGYLIIKNCKQKIKKLLEGVEINFKLILSFLRFNFAIN